MAPKGAVFVLSDWHRFTQTCVGCLSSAKHLLFVVFWILDWVSSLFSAQAGQWVQELSSFWGNLQSLLLALVRLVELRLKFWQPSSQPPACHRLSNMSCPSFHMAVLLFLSPAAPPAFSPPATDLWQHPIGWFYGWNSAANHRSSSLHLLWNFFGTINDMIHCFAYPYPPWEGVWIFSGTTHGRFGFIQHSTMPNNKYILSIIKMDLLNKVKINTLATKHFKTSMVSQHYWDMVHQAVHVWGDDYRLRKPGPVPDMFTICFPQLCVCKIKQLFFVTWLWKTFVQKHS